MIIIGITGGIGSGKSFVTKILKEEYGAAVIDTDSIGHKLLLKTGPAYQDILSAFGKEILDTEKEIDRKKLGLIVFQDRKRLEILNQILHPLVEEEVDARLERYRKEGVEVACLETAILFDVGYEKKCDEVWFVHTSKETRLKRLMSTRQLSKESCEDIFNKQRSSQDFKNKSDRVIENTLDEESTIRQVRTLMALIRGGRDARIT